MDKLNIYEQKAIEVAKTISGNEIEEITIDRHNDEFGKLTVINLYLKDTLKEDQDYFDLESNATKEFSKYENESLFEKFITPISFSFK